MAKKPSGRYKDADAMLTALEAVITKLPASALNAGRRRPTPRPLRVAPKRSRFFRRALIVVVGAGALGAGAVYLKFRFDGTKAVETAALPAKPRTKAQKLAAPAPPPPPKPALPPAPPPTVAQPAPPPPTPVTTPKPEPPAPPPAKPIAIAENEAPSEKPEPVEDDEAKQPRQRESAAQPRTRARNPWKEPVPGAIRPLRDKINRGVHVSQKALQPLYDFAHQNPTDPRPWLLLGRAYAQVDWFSDAVERYVKAHKVDSTCRGDPQMLADLIKGAAHPTAGRAAARAVRSIYGAEAIPALEKAMKARAGDKAASARLAQLRESLPR